MKRGIFVAILFMAGFLYHQVNQDDGMSAAKYVVRVSTEDGGKCTGVEVKYKNQFYILTAAHCVGDLPLEIFTDSATISYPDETSMPKRILKVDAVQDIAVIESTRNSGLLLARSVFENERVHTVTHGGGYPIYRSDGNLIKENFLSSERFPDFIRTLTTAWVIPGSSGGPLLNDNDQLVGIVTNYSVDYRFFSLCTPVARIREILDSLTL